MPVEGVDRLRLVAAHLREGDKELRRSLSSALTKAARGFKKAVMDEIGPAVPKGYEPVLAGSLRITQSIRTGGGSLQMDLVGKAKGKGEARDLPTIDAGILRHPVYGRTRPVRRLSVYRALSLKNPWVAQPIRGGFWSRPAERMGAQVQDEVQKAVDEAAARIEESL